MNLNGTTANSTGAIYMRERVYLEKDFTSVHILPELAEQK